MRFIPDSLEQKDLLLGCVLRRLGFLREES
jgi:hypothetical protein